MSLTGQAEKLRVRMLKTIRTRKRFVGYEGSRHAVGQVPSTNLGPYPPTMIANWMVARFAGKPLTSEKWFVHSNGSITKTPV